MHDMAEQSTSSQIFDRKTLLALAAMLHAFITVLFAMGRIPYCECGLRLWTWDAWSSENSQNFGDPYSFSHFLHGIIFYGVLRLMFRKLDIRTIFLIAIAIEIGWEILENTPFIINRYRAATASLDYYGDSVLNSVGDVLFTIAGFWITHKLRWPYTVAIILIVELLMLYTIRDNLMLNVLMLVYPVDAIREWQLMH